MLLLSLAPTLSGCIIPVVPDFKDPPATQNFPPQILTTMPEGGLPSPTEAFQITVTDPNGDLIRVHWYAEYPPNNLMKTVSIPEAEPPIIQMDGERRLETHRVKVGCVEHNLDRNTTSHGIAALVADRPFMVTDDNLDLLDDGTLAVRVTWTYEHACSPPLPPGPAP